MGDPYFELSQQLFESNQLVARIASMQDQKATPIILPDSKLGQAAEKNVSEMLANEQNKL
jgi:hypothetical protein